MLAIALLALAGAALQPAHAQSTQWSTVPAAQEASAVDPPGRIGRLAEIQGGAWIWHPDEGEWIGALRNRPVTSGDRLSTDAQSRLELQVGSTALRLDDRTDVEIVRIDDEAIEVDLRAGSIALRVRNDEAARDLLLRTADGSFVLQRAGSYRIDRRDDRSEITVWAGQAVYNGPQSALTVYHGQRAVFWLDEGRRAQYVLEQPRFDAFASWSGERDRLADTATAYRHVSPEMTGVEDLDRYGQWTEDPEYGALWAPHQVPAGWAPYQSGHWAWVAPWGWSWVDDAPWGFAPFHYGRWVVVDNRWWWAPGRRVARPVYAPALVGWVGGGTGVSIGIGAGHGVGWFPLAPREPYVPGYRVSRDYVRGVNGPHFRHPADIDRIVQVTSVQRGIEYRNRKFHHGTTSIPAEAFMRRGGGRVVVDPERRRGDGSRDFDRLPGSALVAAPPPPWAGPNRERRERPPGRDLREAGQPFARESGADPRRDGGPGDGWRRDGRRFIDPGDPRSDGPGRQPRRGPPSAEAIAAPAPISAPVFTAPVAPPGPPLQRADRPERPGRGERPDRGFDRPEFRGGRPDRGMPPFAGGPQQPAAAAPIVQAPPPMMPPQPQMPAQPNRRFDPPQQMPPGGERRMRAEPRGEDGGRRGGRPTTNWGDQP